MVPVLEDLLELHLEGDRAACHHVLDFKLSQNYFKSISHHSLNRFRVVFGRIHTHLFTFGSRDDHFSSPENQGGSFGWLFQSHDHSCEPFGVVFGVPALEGDFTQIESGMTIAQNGCTDQIL